VVARRGRNGTAEAEEYAFQRVLERMLSRDGIRRGAYDYISHYHILGACEVITSLCFGNRCEFGTIDTPEQNSKVFLKQKCGTREARPKDSRRIPPTNSEFLARWRALIFRRGGGSKSEARNLLCPKIQKEFLLCKYFLV
jgi:hypothetical protein